MISHQANFPSFHSNFKKGMTLDEYLSEMETLHSNQLKEEKVEQDLYSTSKKNDPSLSRKIITYQIRESEEDDYEESHGQNNFDPDNLKMSVQLGHKEHKLSNKNILLDFPGSQVKGSLSNSRGFRIRKQSNSPFNYQKKEVGPSPSKNFAMTLFNTDWKNSSGSKSTNPSTSLYGKFLKGIKQSEEKQKTSSKQKHFQKKNNQQLENIIKYERGIQQKYNRNNLISDNIDIRIQGITDRLHQRRGISFKNQK